MLVSFGNYLLSTHGVKLPNRNNEEAQVTDADLANWQDEVTNRISDMRLKEDAV